MTVFLILSSHSDTSSSQLNKIGKSALSITDLISKFPNIMTFFQHITNHFVNDNIEDTIREAVKKKV